MVAEKSLKYRRVALVNPYPYYASGTNEATVYPPIGLAYIASCIERLGAEVVIIDANIFRLGNEKVAERLARFKPDIVGIQLNIVTAKAGMELCGILKKRMDVPVVYGGPFASSNHTKLLDTGADAVVIGEGELTFQEICEGRDWTRIDGMFFRRSGRSTMTKPRGLIENLDDLPFPAFHLLPDLKLYRSRTRKLPMAPIFTSRGCPFMCTYCNSNIFGKRFRARSPENVMREIDMLVSKYGVRQLDILDDNFTLDLERAEKIIDMLIAKGYGLAINMQNGLRADKLTPGLILKMKEAGVYKVGIGIETGNKEVLKSIRKGLNLESVGRALKWFRQAGIVTIGFFMLGFPEDTPSTMKDTIEFAVNSNPDIANFSIVIPLPGTELFNYVRDRGWLAEELDEGVSGGFYSAISTTRPPRSDARQ
ncbi:MAG: radical SAM protein [Candidatus Aenigmarchaeota archaeon]|nr:radical SAM protein [Candidatus Aenigmarchaeota archaeon]